MSNAQVRVFQKYFNKFLLHAQKYRTIPLNLDISSRKVTINTTNNNKIVDIFFSIILKQIKVMSAINLYRIFFHDLLIIIEKKIHFIY